jgi:rubredoxin
MNIFILLRIFIPGGIITHDNLVEIVNLAKKFNVRSVQFGLRQDINISVERHYLDNLKLYLDNLNFDYEFNTDWSRNIVTSYVANGIFPSENWLTEGTYLDILDTFDYQPKLRINIVDPNQGLVPLFTGHLNFIASKTNNYWYLKMELPKWFSTVTSWTSLIYSDDISKVAKNIEAIYETEATLTLNELVEKINQVIHGNSRRIEQELKLPNVQLPYYEGFNKTGNTYWLGIYKRSYQFPIEFIEAISELCYNNHINKIGITPWRSILIKDIKESDWVKWIKLLGKYGINIRHSSLELNWRIPDFDNFAIDLKQYLVNEFDKHDIRTYGLTFAIRTKKVDLDAIIVIERIPVKSMFKDKKIAGNYNIFHTKNFEANSKEYILFAEDISYSSISSKLQQLTNYYYEQQSLPSEEEIKNSLKKMNEKQIIHRCKDCLTTYNAEFGDTVNRIAVGTSFEKLPDSYSCPVCDAPISNFELVETDKNSVIT